MRKVLSYGGGLDSYVMLLQAIERGELPDVVVFVDVGDLEGIDPAEWPSTYRHIREVVIPLCRLHGIRFEWIDTKRYPVRDARSLFAWLVAREQIPVAGPNRICTRIAKVERFEAWLDDTYPDQAVEVWIGFEAGEEDRAAKDPNRGSDRAPAAGQAARRNRFPLMETATCRCRAAAYCRARGLAIPRKSACVFCPYGSKGDWQTFAAQLPGWFAMTAELERAKPPTSRGRKLSIMNFRSFEKRPAPKKTKLRILADNAGILYSAPTVYEFIQGAYRRKSELCGVCRELRESKATGCDYAEEAA